MTAPQSLGRPRPAKLSVDDFLVLDRSGAFERYGKSELIDGRVYVMNAQHRAHARAKTRLAFALMTALKGIEGLEAVIEGAVEIPPRSVPEPDIVVTGEPDGEGLIPLASVRQIVEVSDSTLKADLGKKARLYAVAGVPEYWVLDLAARKLHQHWSPGAKGYGQRREVTLGQSIEAATIAGLQVETQGI